MRGRQQIKQIDARKAFIEKSSLNIIHRLWKYWLASSHTDIAKIELKLQILLFLQKRLAKYLASDIYAVL